MNERTNTLLYKNISHTLFSKGLMFLWCVRDGWRDIYSERGLLPISSSRSQGVPTLAPPCKLIRDDLISCVSLARLRISALCPNLTAWFSSHGLLPVTHLLYPSAKIVLACLLITAWQFVIAHGVTRNEPKIHGICYITLSNNPVYCHLSFKWPQNVFFFFFFYPLFLP